MPLTARWLSEFLVHFQIQYSSPFESLVQADQHRVSKYCTFVSKLKWIELVSFRLNSRHSVSSYFLNNASAFSSAWFFMLAVTGTAFGLATPHWWKQEQVKEQNRILKWTASCQTSKDTIPPCPRLHGYFYQIFILWALLGKREKLWNSENLLEYSFVK